MIRLATVVLDGIPRVIDLYSGTLIEGNFESYSASPFSAFTSMWGHYRTDLLVAESTMRVYPETFPNGTIFTWDVTPAPDWAGVNGYLHVAYGNYSESPGTITSRQISNITDLTVTIDWIFNGDEGSGLLAECWLTATTAPSGAFTPTHEIAFFPKLSPSAITYVQSLPVVGGGSFTDTGGVVWNVRQGVSGVGGVPYLIAYRPGHVAFTGALRFDDFFAFLISAGKITGSAWFNGVGFGVEPHEGVGSLKITEFSPAYAGT